MSVRLSLALFSKQKTSASLELPQSRPTTSLTNNRGPKMLRSSLLALLAATAAATLADATIVTITNQCGERVDLWDNKASVPLSPGESVIRDLPNGYQGMFRNGVNPQATRTSHLRVIWNGHYNESGSI